LLPSFEKLRLLLLPKVLTNVKTFLVAREGVKFLHAPRNFSRMNIFHQNRKNERTHQSQRETIEHHMNQTHKAIKIKL
jgi:hypothetical protein